MRRNETQLNVVTSTHATHNPVYDAVQYLGGPEKVPFLLYTKFNMKVSNWAVKKWVQRGIPAAFVIPFACLTDNKFTPHQLRPDLYPDETWVVRKEVCEMCKVR